MTKARLYLHHQGEFHHNYCAVVSLYDSDHDGSQNLCKPFLQAVRFIYITRHNYSPTRSVMCMNVTIHVHMYIIMYIHTCMYSES